MITPSELKKLFEVANATLLEQDYALFTSKVNERTVCGALMSHLRDLTKEDNKYDGYYVDTEYNRNKGQIKTIIKTIKGPDLSVIRINCDLIIHSRGERPEQDNLLAVEMKKSYRSQKAKDEDRNRLIALTKDSFDDVWSFDGHTLPEHVCRYVLGVYYEINFSKNEIEIEYYQKGKCVNSYAVDLNKK